MRLHRGQVRDGVTPAPAVFIPADSAVGSGARTWLRAALFAAMALVTMALVTFGPGPVSAQVGPFLYVPNNISDTVSVFDTSTNTVVATIPTASIEPSAAAVRGDQSLVYVAHTIAGTGMVSVIDTATNTITATIPVGSVSAAIALSADGKLAYTANVGGGTVSVIDTASNTVTATIPVGSLPLGVAVSPDGSRVYVTNNGSASVSVINAATNTVMATVPVGVDPDGVWVSPDGSRVYVANANSATVSVINAATNTVAATIPVALGPVAVTASPDGSRIYVASAGNMVSVIDAATNTVVATIPVGNGPNGITISPDGSRIYVTRQAGNAVTVIDTATNTVVTSTPVGVLPAGPGICGNGNALLTAGNTFVAKQSSAIACTGVGGPVFTGGTMQMAGATFASDLAVNVLAQGGTITGAIAGTGGLVKNGPGALLLTDTSTYTGTTTVNAGTLIVNGSIAPSILTTVNAGATLGGTGTVGNTVINGGMLAPGNSIGTITIAGNLTMTAASTYQVEVSPTEADRTNVTGTAALGGATVQALFQPGSYIVRTYTILSAVGGLGGSTFGAFTTVNLPANFAANLSYTPTDVILNLTATLGGGGSLNVNQGNVAGAINTAFNSGVPLPAGFLPVFSLTGPSLANALSQLSGEVATGTQQAGFRALDLFLGAMLNPFLNGRGEAAASGPAVAFAPERQASSHVLPRDAASAYAAALKAPASFEQRWSVWGSGFGGTSRTDGDAFIGSNSARADAYGFAVGLDHRLSPDTIVGFALAGGGTSWNLAGGLGSGRSDMFQAGVYGSHRFAGAAYVSAALAYTWHDASTSRTITSPALGVLNANFDANSFGGRIEGGYRFATALAGITPYGALQALHIRTPAYTETGVGVPFALSYGSRNVTATRSELGLWFDRSTRLNPDAAITLRARAAWAHDFNTDRQIAATFQTLPLASFTVTGASPAPDYGLLSGAAELRLRNGWSFALKGDAELAPRTQTYSGTGVVRYSW